MGSFQAFIDYLEEQNAKIATEADLAFINEHHKGLFTFDELFDKLPYTLKMHLALRVLNECRRMPKGLSTIRVLKWAFAQYSVGYKAYNAYDSILLLIENICRYIKEQLGVYFGETECPISLWRPTDPFPKPKSTSANNVCKYVKEETYTMHPTKDEGDMRKYAEEELMLTTAATKAGLPLARVKTLRARYSAHFSGKAAKSVKRWEIALLIMMDAVNKGSCPKYVRKDEVIAHVVGFARELREQAVPSYWTTEAFVEELNSEALRYKKAHANDVTDMMHPPKAPYPAPAKEDEAGKIPLPNGDIHLEPGGVYLAHGFKGITSHFIDVWVLNDGNILLGHGATVQDAILDAREQFDKQNEFRRVSVTSMLHKEIEVPYEANVSIIPPGNGK